MNDVQALFERQIAYVRRQPAERLLLAMPRFIRFLQSEPRLRAIVDDLRWEFQDALSAYWAADERLIRTLSQLWSLHRSWFVRTWGSSVSNAGGNPVWAEARLSPESFDEQLSSACRIDLDRFAFPEEPGTAGTLLRALRDWWSCIEDEASTESADVASFLAGLRQVDADHDRTRRAFLIVTRTHAGASYERLTEHAASLLPKEERHSPDDDNWSLLNSALATLEERRIGNIALGLGDRNEYDSLTIYRNQILADLDTLSEEILHRIGLHLSHRALVQRFKTRCERFLAPSLREAVAGAGDRKPEDILTMAAAQHLFDAGLNPLFNASIVSLRPDLFDANLPYSLYIEAKQYIDAPRALIKKAAWQVWDTWSELEGEHKVAEAFLLVFRRGGPLVVFEGAAKLRDRTLHPILVDIAENTARGSRAKTGPIRIAPADLLPDTRE